MTVPIYGRGRKSKAPEDRDSWASIFYGPLTPQNVAGHYQQAARYFTTTKVYCVRLAERQVALFGFSTYYR